MAFLAGIGAGLTDLAGSFGLQAQSYSNQSSLQNQYFQGQANLINQQHDLATSDFTKYGLPSFMASGSNFSNRLPTTYFQTAGANFSRGGPFGSNQPIQSNVYQQLLGWGRPSTNQATNTPSAGRNYTPGSSNNYIPKPGEEPPPQRPGGVPNWHLPGNLYNYSLTGGSLQQAEGNYDPVIRSPQSENQSYGPFENSPLTRENTGIYRIGQGASGSGNFNVQYQNPIDPTQFSWFDPFSPWGAGRNSSD